MNLVDFLIILLLLLGVINGYRKGFFGTLVGIFSSICGLLAAYHYYPVLIQWADEKFGIVAILDGYFKEHLVLPQVVNQFKVDSLNLPRLNEVLNLVQLPPSLHAQLLSYIDKIQATLTLPTSLGLGEVIHQFLATIITNAIAFVLIWFIVDMLINLIATALTRLTNGTVLGGINHLGGMAMGFVLTIFTLTILIGLISPLFHLADVVESSVFSAVLNTISEAQTVPYFMELYTAVSGKLVNLLLL